MVAKDESLLVGLLAGEKIVESRACFDGARESRAIWVEGKSAHRKEGTKSFDRVAVASQVGDDRVPGEDIGLVHVLVKPGCQVLVGGIMASADFMMNYD